MRGAAVVTTASAVTWRRRRARPAHESAGGHRLISRDRLTIDCLRSLAPEIGRVPGARVSVCENGTGGDAEARIRCAIEENGWGARLDLTAIHPHRGFNGGNNAVIRPALASADLPEYVLLLNADIIVREHALDVPVHLPERASEGGDRRQPAPLARRGAAGLAVPVPGGQDTAKMFRNSAVKSESRLR